MCAYRAQPCKRESWSLLGRDSGNGGCLLVSTQQVVEEVRFPKTPTNSLFSCFQAGAAVVVLAAAEVGIGFVLNLP